MFFKVFLQITQVTLSLALIVAVLLHSAKGEGLGGIGGQAHVFGSQKGVEEGLNKVTSAIAALWMIVSLAIVLVGKTI
ncbi:MAG TPA: preprotein translocase subunit SecG [Cyanobacteria bacterium UBA8530]|nr:preprotein translocase subunit SecG [Cyanobacteria bacterium UBA8530]